LRKKGHGARNDINGFVKAIENETYRVDMFRQYFMEMGKYRSSYYDFKTCLQKEKQMQQIALQMETHTPIVPCN